MHILGLGTSGIASTPVRQVRVSARRIRVDDVVNLHAHLSSGHTITIQHLLEIHEHQRAQEHLIVLEITNHADGHAIAQAVLTLQIVADLQDERLHQRRSVRRMVELEDGAQQLPQRGGADLHV